MFIKVEPYWNVKIRTLENWESGKSIKVEPYWNVKCTGMHEPGFRHMIKVEPYWNVKDYESELINDRLN